MHPLMFSVSALFFPDLGMSVRALLLSDFGNFGNFGNVYAHLCFSRARLFFRTLRYVFLDVDTGFHDIGFDSIRKTLKRVYISYWQADKQNLVTHKRPS